VDADDLAVVVVQRLGVFLARKALAQRQEELAVGGAAGPAFDDAAAEVRAAGHLGLLAEDDLEVLQPAVVGAQGRPRQRRAVAAARGPGFGKAEKDRAVAGKVAVGDHVQQPTLPAGGNLGQPGHGRRQLAVSRDDP
jgi:hypothetical protein